MATNQENLSHVLTEKSHPIAGKTVTGILPSSVTLANGTSTTTPTSMTPTMTTTTATATSEKPLKSKRHIVGRMRKVPLLGIFFAILYAFFMSTSVAIVKFIDGIHPIEILVFRSIIQGVVFTALAVYKGVPLLGYPSERWHVFSRAVTGTANQGCWYLSVRKISLMDSSAIFYSAPVFVGLLAFLFLKEPFGIFEGLSIVITIVGVLLISRPQFIPIFANNNHPMTTDTIEGLVLALFGSFTFALSNVALRKLQKTATEVIALWFSLTTVILGTILVVWLDAVRLPKDAMQWFLITCVGILGLLGQISFSLALKIEKAGPVSIAQTVNIVIVLIYQLAFFNEPISTLGLIGAILIGSSVMLIGMKDFMKNGNFTENIKRFSTRTVSWQVDQSMNGTYTPKYLNELPIPISNGTNCINNNNNFDKLYNTSTSYSNSNNNNSM